MLQRIGATYRASGIAPALPAAKSGRERELGALLAPSTEVVRYIVGPQRRGEEPPGARGAGARAPQGRGGRLIRFPVVTGAQATDAGAEGHGLADRAAHRLPAWQRLRPADARGRLRVDGALPSKAAAPPCWCSTTSTSRRPRSSPRSTPSAAAAPPRASGASRFLTTARVAPEGAEAMALGALDCPAFEGLCRGLFIDSSRPDRRGARRQRGQPLVAPRLARRRTDHPRRRARSRPRPLLRSDLAARRPRARRRRHRIRRALPQDCRRRARPRRHARAARRAARGLAAHPPPSRARSSTRSPRRRSRATSPKRWPRSSSPSASPTRCWPSPTRPPPRFVRVADAPLRARAPRRAARSRRGRARAKAASAPSSSTPSSRSRPTRASARRRASSGSSASRARRAWPPTTPSPRVARRSRARPRRAAPALAAPPRRAGSRAKATPDGARSSLSDARASAAAR